MRRDQLTVRFHRDETVVSNWSCGRFHMSKPRPKSNQLNPLVEQLSQRRVCDVVMGSKVRRETVEATIVRN